MKHSISDYDDKSQYAIVLIDDNTSLLANLADYLSLQFDYIFTFADPAEALADIDDHFAGVVVTDVRMPGLDGFGVLATLLEKDKDFPIILFTAHGDIPQAVKAMQLGCYDFIEKPFAPERLVESVTRAINKRRLTLAGRSLTARLQAKKGMASRILGESACVSRLKEEILAIARLDVPVLLHGETGSGKEVVAGCLHEFGNRHKGHFVPINCGAIPNDLLESELFGHVKGAFTGAFENRQGKFEYARGGTLFLDEIESIPPNAQVKLLRVLSEQKFEALGSNARINTDARIISATKADLKAHPGFRQDLFYRLQVAEIFIPPLRQRKADIPLLFEHYAVKFCQQAGLAWQGVPAGLQGELLDYAWPGNVRELINVATRFALNPASDLAALLGRRAPVLPTEDADRGLQKRLHNYERALLESALRRHAGSVSKVLRELGLERRTFNLKLKKYGLSRGSFTGKREDQGR